MLILNPLPSPFLTHGCPSTAPCVFHRWIFAHPCFPQLNCYNIRWLSHPHLQQHYISTQLPEWSGNQKSLRFQGAFDPFHCSSSTWLISWWYFGLFLYNHQHSASFSQQWLVTMEDGLELVQKIPNPNAGPGDYTTASEWQQCNMREKSPSVLIRVLTSSRQEGKVSISRFIIPLPRCLKLQEYQNWRYLCDRTDNGASMVRW